jgi:hypothetical protein
MKQSADARRLAQMGKRRTGHFAVRDWIDDKSKFDDFQWRGQIPREVAAAWSAARPRLLGYCGSFTSVRYEVSLLILPFSISNASQNTACKTPPSFRCSTFNSPRQPGRCPDNAGLTSNSPRRCESRSRVRPRCHNLRAYVARQRGHAMSRDVVPLCPSPRMSCRVKISFQPRNVSRLWFPLRRTQNVDNFFLSRPPETVMRLIPSIGTTSLRVKPSCQIAKICEDSARSHQKPNGEN